MSEIDRRGIEAVVTEALERAVRAHLAMELIAESGQMSCPEVVEVNPILDQQNATAARAVELAASAFGATTLSGGPDRDLACGPCPTSG